MTYKKICEDIFEAGKNLIEDMEIYISKDSKMSINVFGGELNKFSLADSEGLSLRGIVDGRMGYSYTEKIDSSSVEDLVQGVFNSAKTLDSLDKPVLYDGSGSYERVEKPESDFENITIPEKIQFLKDLEANVLKMDGRIVSVQSVNYVEMVNEIFMKNTLGMDLKDRFTKGIMYISIMAKDGEEVKTGMAYRVFDNFKDLNLEEIGNEVVNNTLGQFGGSSLKTGTYPVIIENTTFADLLEAFVPIFSAENVDKGLSNLKDKIGDKIAVEGFNLIDNPFYEKGLSIKSFDDEGVPTKSKNVIENGILKTYFHNLKTAEKYKLEATGNGVRSYKSSVGILPSNLYVENGKVSLIDMMEDISYGVLIDDLQGLHAGLDSISGDFSLSAGGKLIEDGKITRPVELITIAGNFYKLLKDIEEIGDDLKFTLPGNGYVGSPSIKIKSLSIAGE